MPIGLDKIFSANSRLTAAVFAGLTLTSFGSAAHAIGYTTSSLTLTKLGDTIDSQYDQLQVAGITGSNLTANTTADIGTLSFTAGVNATVPHDYTGVYSFTENVSIGGNGGSLVVPFNLNISYSDTLTVVAGATLSILVGADFWNLAVNSLTIGPNPGGTMVRTLTAYVTESPAATPLPAALVLFGSGLGALGIFGRRRKPKASDVLAA